MQNKKKITLELSKAEYELLRFALENARKLVIESGLSDSQKHLKHFKLHSIQSHIEDSWDISK